MNTDEALDMVYARGYDSVWIRRTGYSDDMAWSVTAQRTSGIPAATVTRDVGSVTTDGATMTIHHYGPTRSDALAALASLAVHAERIIAEARQGNQ